MCNTCFSKNACCICWNDSENVTCNIIFALKSNFWFCDGNDILLWQLWKKHENVQITLKYNQSYAKTIVPDPLMNI